MKKLLILISLLMAFQITYAQESKRNDKSSPTLDMEIGKMVTDPHFILMLKDKKHIELTKPEMRIIQKNWIKQIDVWTTDEKRKEFGVADRGGLVLITLKERRLEKYLKMINRQDN